MNKLAVLVVVASECLDEDDCVLTRHNGDSQRHTFDAVCSGSKASLVTDGNTTGTATIQGSGPCKVKHAGGEVELKGGEKLEIKDGKISLK